MAASPVQSLQDAFHVALGFGVMNFQKVQVRRQELRKEVSSQITETVDVIEKLVKDAEERLEPVVDALTGRLPEQAQGIVEAATDAVKGGVDSLLALARKAA